MVYCLFRGGVQSTETKDLQIIDTNELINTKVHREKHLDLHATYIKFC